MTTNHIAVHTLARYYRAHQDGSLLGNEPARLLCEFLDSQLSPDAAKAYESAIEALLGETHLDHLSGVETLGGIRVTVGRMMSLAHYGRGKDFYPLAVSQLLELAKLSDATGESAPLPPWVGDVWAQPFFEVDAALSHLSFRETVKILAAHNVPLRVTDGVPTFKVNECWFDDPQIALKTLLETCPADKREEIARSM